jgi:hypothetical protein
MADLERRLRQLKPDVRPTTIKVYAANIRRLRKIGGKALEYGPVSQYLKGLSVTNAVNLLTAIIVLEGRERYGLLYDSLNESAALVRHSQQFTPAEREQWTSSKVIREGLNRARFDVDRLKLLEVKKHPRSHLHILTQYLVLRFHTEFQWRSDLPSVRIGKHTGENYFYNGRFVLNHFKTSEHFKRRKLLPLIFTPSRGLATLIRQFLEVRAAQGIEHDFLIVNRSLNPVRRDAYYKFLSAATFKYVGKKFGASMFRHIYTTEFLAGSPSLQQKQRKLRSMMQLSLETFESYARRS